MDRAALAAFADLFSYPRSDVVAVARRCLSITNQPPLRGFVAWAQRATAAEVEEAYTAAFDLEPVCVPYLGEHLCPERRPLFIAGLVELYAADDFVPRDELPDHLAEVLRFLAVARDEKARFELLRDALEPALAKMARALEGNPYQAPLQALRAELQRAEEARP